MTGSAKRGLAAIPRGIWTLGLVSMCMDLSSELIHSLLPLYLALELGASTLTIGLLEGFAEATALIVKVFSGFLSDFFRRRKALVVLGYGLAALTKPVFPLAPSLGWIVGARIADRVGKGIRGAPRDALIADITPDAVRGASFGLRQALDTVGAVGGPLIAIAAMLYFADDFRSVFWIAVIPAALSVLLLVVGVDEPDRVGAAPAADPSKRVRMADVRRLGHKYAIIVAFAAVFTLARFSEAFLVLRAQNVGLPVGSAPWVMVIMSLVYAVVSYPAGAAADRGKGPWLLSAGLGALIVADLVLANAQGGATVFDRRGAVGPAHGADAGTARGARRGGGAGRPARHRLRCVQPRVRRGAARGERARRLAMAGVRSGADVLCGRGVCRRSRGSASPCTAEAPRSCVKPEADFAPRAPATATMEAAA